MNIDNDQIDCGISGETRSRVASRELEILGQPPRFKTVARSDVAEEVVEVTHRLRQELFGDGPRLDIEQVPEIMVTMHPFGVLWQRIIALSLTLMGPNCKLTRRDQKLVILRTSWLVGAPYEFGEHVGQARALGFSDAEISAIVEHGSTSMIWSDHERALLRASEELHANAFISDETWSTLSQSLDQQQLFELVVLIGQFTSVAYFQNSLRLALESGKAGLTGALPDNVAK